MIRIIGCAALAILTTACATRIEKPQMNVFNGTPENINIHIKRCGTSDDAYNKVATVAPSSNKVIKISQKCADAIATAPGGQRLGEQSNLRVPPEINWNVF